MSGRARSETVASPRSAPLVISSPMPTSDLHQDKQRLGFFGALKKKLKGSTRHQEEVVQKLKETSKEDDKVFDDAHRGFLELEGALLKLQDHLEKQMHAMRESMLYQQMIAQDLFYFFGQKGSYYAKGAEEYKTTAREHLMTLSSTIFPALAERAMQPIKAHLAAMPAIKDLIEVRARSKLELDLYKAKVHSLRKAAGLGDSGPLSPAACASLPSGVADRLSRKVAKLNGLSTEYERLDRGLLVSLVRYVNSKDALLNAATRAYLETMQEYARQNLVLHTNDVRLLLKSLQDTAVESNKQLADANNSKPTAPETHRKSASAQVVVTRNPVAAGGLPSPSSAGGKLTSSANGSLLPLSPAEDLDEAVLNPLHRGADADPFGLLHDFDRLLAHQIKAREQKKHARRTSAMLALPPAAMPGTVPSPRSTASATSSASNSNHTGRSGGAGGNGNSFTPSAIGAHTSRPAGALAYTAPSISFARPSPDGSGGLGKVTLYNNPPFLSSTPFTKIHAMLAPTAPQLPAPAAVETTSHALAQLNQPTRTSVGGSTSAPLLPLVTLVTGTVSALAGVSSSSSSTVNSTTSADGLPRFARTTSLDTKSHLLGLGLAKSTIPIVNTGAFLQQHRTEGLKNNAAAAAAAATAVMKGPPLSEQPKNSAAPPAIISPELKTKSTPTIETSGGKGSRKSSLDSLKPPTSASGTQPLSPFSSASSSASPPSAGASALAIAATADDDDDDDIPPPPDWDDYADTESSEDDSEDDDGFVTPRGVSMSRAFSYSAAAAAAAVHSRQPTQEMDSVPIATPILAPATATATATAAIPAVASSAAPLRLEIAPPSAGTISAPAPVPAVSFSSSSSSAPVASITTATPASAPAAVVAPPQRSKPILTGKFAALSEKFGRTEPIVAAAPSAAPAGVTSTPPAATPTIVATSTLAAIATPAVAAPIVAASVDSKTPPEATPSPAASVSAASVTIDAATAATDSAGFEASLALVSSHVDSMLGAKNAAPAASTEIATGTVSTAPPAAPTAVEQPPASTPSAAAAPAAPAATPAATKVPGRLLVTSPIQTAAAKASSNAVAPKSSVKSPVVAASRPALDPTPAAVPTLIPTAASNTPSGAASAAATIAASRAPTVVAAAAAPTSVVAQTTPTSAPAPVPSDPPMRTVSALYDYTAQRDVEISFKQGDVVCVLSEDASGWWTGQVRGSTRVGVFPSNFCNTA